jgi:hypothetical protein
MSAWNDPPNEDIVLHPTHQEDVSVAQNANAPTPIRDPLHELPARDSPAEPGTPARSWLHRQVPFAFIRFLMIFFIGVVATLAWQSYGRAARKAIASWLAPDPVAQAASTAFADASSDDLLAMSRSLAALRDGVDKLAADVTKLQATKQGAPDVASAHPPTSAGAPAQKPVPSAPTPPRAPPTR